MTESLLKPDHELPTADQAEALRPGESDPLQRLEAALKTKNEAAHQASEKSQAEKASAEKAESARAEIEQTDAAENLKDNLDNLNSENDDAQQAAPISIDKNLKNITKQRELKRIRRQLPKQEQALSKVIHQKAVQAVSETASKTVTRPSGVLGGGVLAFIGSLSYLYFTKHLGVPYNYLVFSIFFVGGFVIGLVLELGIRVFRQKKQT